ADRRHEQTPGQSLLQAVVLGTVTDPDGETRIVPRALAQDADRTRRGAHEPDENPHERRLARAVGPEKTRDPGLDRERDIVERDHAPVPLVEMLRLDDHSSPSTERSRRQTSVSERSVIAPRMASGSIQPQS